MQAEELQMAVKTNKKIKRKLFFVGKVLPMEIKGFGGNFEM